MSRVTISSQTLSRSTRSLATRIATFKCGSERDNEGVFGSLSNHRLRHRDANTSHYCHCRGDASQPDAPRTIRPRFTRRWQLSCRPSRGLGRSPECRSLPTFGSSVKAAIRTETLGVAVCLRPGAFKGALVVLTCRKDFECGPLARCRSGLRRSGGSDRQMAV